MYESIHVHVVPFYALASPSYIFLISYVDALITFQILNVTNLDMTPLFDIESLLKSP